MPVELISVGPLTNLLANVVYALPASPCTIKAGAVLQKSTSYAGTYSDWIGSDSGVYHSGGGHTKCVTGNTTVTATKVKKTGSYSQAVMKDGPSNYWKLNEASGLVAVDPVGGKNGTISGGVTLNQPGALSNDSAMTFDGVTGKIVTAAPVTAPLACSVEAWFKCAFGYDTNFHVIITNRDATPEAAIFVAVSEDKLYIYCAPTALISNKSVTDGLWHHGVFVSNGTIGWVYIDGVLDNTNPSLPRGVTSHPVGIGYDIKNNGYYFIGQLDELAIYPYALSSAQVAAHYAARK
jgi:hypothetical protein